MSRKARKWSDAWALRQFKRHAPEVFRRGWWFWVAAGPALHGRDCFILGLRRGEGSVEFCTVWLFVVDGAPRFRVDGAGEFATDVALAVKGGA